MTERELKQMRSLLMKASDPDRYAARIQYIDADGKVTDRIVSPIRMTTPTTVRALCLHRQEVRQFCLASIRTIELVPAHEVLMTHSRKTSCS
ncbi:hypothetical protein Mal65_53950 [Crateriforma conspicua]|nr:hypothetical protein Mal65_53950 [Crateriforma conspicua]